MTHVNKSDFPSKQSYTHASWLLQCEPQVLEAMSIVEAGQFGAFLDTGEPVILYERHVFDALTRGLYRGRRAAGLPDEWSSLSSPVPSYRDRSYGPVSVQHAKLQAAISLDRTAALKSCSWGLYQQLGRDQKYSTSIQRFINAMYRSVDDHLVALVMFIHHKPKLLSAVQDKDWAKIKLYYNGSGNTGRDYAGDMEREYNRLINPSD